MLNPILPSVLSDAEELYRDRIEELVTMSFQDQKLIDKTLKKVFADKPKANVFGVPELSFVESLKCKIAYSLGSLYSLENSVGSLDCHEAVMTDAMRRAGEDIARSIYREVRHSFREQAFNQTDKEFFGLEEKRRRHEDVVAEMRETKSTAKQVKLAALYAFEEERMQYEDDAAFSEYASDDQFRRHLQEVATRCYPHVNLDEALEKVRGLMDSGRMKGKNFRKPKDVT